MQYNLVAFAEMILGRSVADKDVSAQSWFIVPGHFGPFLDGLGGGEWENES